MFLLIILLARSILRKHHCKTNQAVPSAVVVQGRRPLTTTVSFELFCSSTRSRFWRRPRLTRRFEIDTCALPEPRSNRTCSASNFDAVVLECALAQELKRVKELNSLPRSLNANALCDGVNTVDLLVRYSVLC